MTCVIKQNLRGSIEIKVGVEYYVSGLTSVATKISSHQKIIAVTYDKCRIITSQTMLSTCFIICTTHPCLVCAVVCVAQ